MPFSMTPVVGLDLAGTLNQDTGRTVALGTSVIASDGRKYVFVEAGAALAAPGTEVIIDANFAITAGDGDFDTIVAMADGDRAWVKADTVR